MPAEDRSASAESVLVPVAASSTMRETVEYAVESALEASAADPDEPAEAAPDSAGDAAADADEERDRDARPSLHFVFVHAPREFDPDEAAPAIDDAEELLQRVAVWAGEDAGDEDAIDVSTAHLGTDRYLFSPADVAETLLDAARDAGATRIVLDPEYDPGVGAPFLRPLERELQSAGEVVVEEAPVVVPVRRPPILRSLSARRLGVLAGVAFLFYQLLAGGISRFDLATGAATATIVAVSLSRVSIGRDPSLRRTPLRALRGAIYVPYLLWEIVKSNVAVAAVILNPRGEVDPRMTRIEPAVWGALPITSLANSITLTPGTLTVRVDGNELLVHTLLPGARQDLFDGGLERAIRFVFYGRRAMRVDALDERGAAAVVDGLPDGEAARGGEDAAAAGAGSGPDGGEQS